MDYIEKTIGEGGSYEGRFKVIFYPGPHIYKVNGKIVPSVTQILQKAGLSPDYSKVDPEVLYRKQEIGTMTHERCYGINTSIIKGEIECKDKSRLCRSIIEQHGYIEPYSYVRAYINFLCDSGFMPTNAEVTVYNPAYYYIGTVDIIGMLGTNRVIIDLKTPLTDHPSYAVQMAAYKDAWTRLYPDKPIQERISLLLRDNGRYKTEIHDNPYDFNVFLAGLTIYRWKEVKGI